MPKVLLLGCITHTQFGANGINDFLRISTCAGHGGVYIGAPDGNGADSQGNDPVGKRRKEWS